MPEPTVSLDKSGPIARLTLRRPSVDAALLAELARACDAIEGDDSVRAVILAAEGDDFCRGWDQSLLAGEGGPPADAFGCLAELPRPVVCAVQGEALSAGLELALACDIRIAAEDARLGLPETTLGLLPMGGGTQRLARLVGRGKALEMVLTGEPVDAQEALRTGLVSAAVPRERLAAEAEAVAARIAERGPIAVRYAKEAIGRGLEMTLEQALRYETDLTIILQTTEDRAEGVRAFLEKRKPRFKGR
ncbi:MAG: enoyl-CoA hydratase/isomerase family protein [Dehalococcoidia bacterium]|nr:enoyl-CoA hydratase/isomerase family protein [Dehalococcoidia bacterium]